MGNAMAISEFVAAEITEDIVLSGLDAIEHKLFQGLIPGHVTEHAVNMLETAMNTAYMELCEQPEEDFEEEKEPVIAA